jgi:alkylhydroperoxidase/carboxymuconolactone decarboxylase family protein YurZ
MKTLNLTENAVKNHEELFPNHESKLQKTDPEFIELFDNWAFDEVIRQSNLDTKTRVMLILASTIASQALGEYRVMVGAALNVGLTPIEIKEILYQSVTYVGVAKVFDFLHATNEILQDNGVRRQEAPQRSISVQSQGNPDSPALFLTFPGSIIPSPFHPLMQFECASGESCQYFNPKLTSISSLTICVRAWDANGGIDCSRHHS